MADYPHKHIREALRHAEAQGCTIRKSGPRAHAWGVIGHADGIELLFERTAESLQAAIAAAISDVERTGYRVSKVEMEREAISV